MNLLSNRDFGDVVSKFGWQALIEQEASIMHAVRHAHVLSVLGVMPEPRVPGMSYLLPERAGCNLRTCLQLHRYTLSWPCHRLSCFGIYGIYNMHCSIKLCISNTHVPGFHWLVKAGNFLFLLPHWHALKRLDSVLRMALYL